MAVLLRERRWRGLDLSRSPEELGEGFLAACDNLVVDGDSLLTRPGYRGQLASLLPSAVWGITPYYSSSGAFALFVADGKLYKWQRGATSATELLEGGASLALVGGSAFFATGPNVAYLVDGSGPLRRVNLTDSAVVPTAPTPTAPSVELVPDYLIDGTDDNYSPTAAPRWFDGQDNVGYSPDNLSDGGFESFGGGTGDWSTSGETIPATADSGIKSAGSYSLKLGQAGSAVWQDFQPAHMYAPGMAVVSTFGSGSTTTNVNLGASAGAVDDAHNGAVLLITSGAQAGQTRSISDYTGSTTTATLSSALPGAPVAGDGYLLRVPLPHQRCRGLRVRFKMYSEDPDGLSAAVVEVIASGAGKLATRRYVAEQAAGAAATDWVLHEFWAGFYELDTDPTSYRLRISAALQNEAGAAVYIDELTCESSPLTLYATRSGSLWAAGTGAPQNAVALYTYMLTAPDSPQGHRLRGVWLGRDLGTAQDLSATARLGAALVMRNPEVRPGLRFGLRPAGNDVNVYWTGEATWTQDGKHVWADISDIPKAVRQGVRYLLVQFTTDAPEGALGNYNYFADFGPVYRVGNLTDGAAYWWRVTELDGATDAALLDVLESDVSPSSPEVVAAPDRAMARLSIGARVGDGTSGKMAATHFALWRYGGTLIPTERGRFPLGLLVGIVSYSQADAGFGSVPAAGSASVANPHLSWDTLGANLGGVVLDNTPDSFLAGARVAREGREAPPATPKDVALWDGRLWLLKGDSEVWASWLLDSNARAGLYFSRATLPSVADPHSALRGWWGRVGIEAGDALLRVVPMDRGALLLFSSRGVWRVGPRQVDELGYLPVRLDGAPGLAARRGVVVLNGECFWLAPDGLWSLSGGLRRVSGRIERALPPWNALTASALATSSLIAWGKRLLLVVPASSGDTSATVAYVWDRESDTWTRWLGASWTGGAALGSTGDTSALVVAGRGGQVFVIEQAGGDRATSGVTVVGVAASATTRTVRTVERRTPGAVRYEGESGEIATLTLTLTGDVAAAASSLTQSLPAARYTGRTRFSPAAVGRSQKLTLAATTIERLRLGWVEVDSVPSVW